MKNTGIKILWMVGIGLIALSAAAPDAWALKITRKRIVFEGSQRAAVLSIINDTAEEQTYRLRWRQMRMTEDNALIPVEDNAQAALAEKFHDLVRYAPRRIVLPPGGTQQVRLMLTKAESLAEGEYRSHLWLQPEAGNAEFNAADGASSQRPQVQLKMLTGMTIPVIVRRGSMRVKATISDMQVAINPEGKGMDVAFTVGRQGNRSLYGDLTFTCDGSVLAREVKGVAIYTDVTQRHMKMTVPFPGNDAASCKKVAVQYIADRDDLDLKGAVLAAAEISIP